MITILIVVLVLVIIGALPIHPYSQDFGYGPSGVFGVLLIILIVLLLLGRL